MSNNSKSERRIQKIREEKPKREKRNEEDIEF